MDALFKMSEIFRHQSVKKNASGIQNTPKLTARR